MANLIVLNNDGTQTTLDSSTLGGSTALFQTELDFGNKPIKSKKFIVGAGGFTGSEKVLIHPCAIPASGRGQDDWEWDSVQFAAKSEIDQFVIYAFSNTKIGGRRTIFYSIN